MNKAVSDSADASDLAFAAAAVCVGIPFFAICRGYQALNVAMGGTLHQDIAADAGSHRPISATPEDVLGERHQISITPTSRLSSAYGGATSRTVNSIHHQAIERVASGFHPVAWADDGTIEAIESDDASAPILAVQWHPEKIVDEGDHLLFEYFVRELVRR